MKHTLTPFVMYCVGPICGRQRNLTWHYHKMIGYFQAIASSAKEHTSLLEEEVSKEQKPYNRVSYREFMENNNRSELAQFCRDWDRDRKDREGIIKNDK
jgi:hypothetical protein